MSAGRKLRRAITRGPTLFVLPGIPDAAPPAVKNAVAIRNQATRTGRCPGCGERCDPADIRPGQVTVVQFGHKPGCPALLEGLPSW